MIRGRGLRAAQGAVSGIYQLNNNYKEKQWVFRPMKVKRPFFEINAINYKGSEKTSEKNNLGLSRKTTYKTSTYRD